MRRILLVLTVLVAAIVMVSGCGGQTGGATAPASASGKAAMAQYSLDVGPGFTAWVDATLAYKKATQANLEPKPFLREIDRCIAMTKLAEGRIDGVTAPGSLSALQATFVERLHQASISAGRFRVAFARYVNGPASAVPTKAKVRSLWSTFADDGIAQVLAMREWSAALAKQADAMGVPEPQWLKDGLAKLKQS